jgi:hypothetical protein
MVNVGVFVALLLVGQVLSTVACRWENDGGDRSTALVYFGPQISTNSSTGAVEQIRYSPKSGGYSPALENPEEMVCATSTPPVAPTHTTVGTALPGRNCVCGGQPL